MVQTVDGTGARLNAVEIINIQWICTEKLTHERMILKMKQKTMSALTGGICNGTDSVPNATIAKSSEFLVLDGLRTRDTTRFRKPWRPVNKVQELRPRGVYNQGPTDFRNCQASSQTTWFTFFS